MNYIGSKLSLLEFLEESINKVVKKDCNVFCDLFAGTGAVGTYFKRKGYKIISNDIQYYSYVLNRHYIKNHQPLEFEGLFNIINILKKTNIKDREKVVLDYLNNLKGKKGFIYNNYCLGGTKNKEESRLYFSDENGLKCDAVRHRIEEWKKKNIVNDNEYYFLLASLVESIDKYANTASVYGAFLKKLKKSALKLMTLRPAELIINDQEHEVYNDDINKVIKKIEGDILYLDPPYNQRQYATNYHILETIAKYDNPKIHGKTGLREYAKQKSTYCSRNQVKKSFKDLIDNARVKYIFLSYNNEGLMSADDIKEVMSSRGKYGFFTKEYTRFKADKNREYKAEKTTEYLHYVVCNN
jgi:adenine-specific DNA-methyltransferase